MADPFLRRRDVEQEVGLSKASIYRLIAAGEFPAPVRIGRNAVRWPLSAIQKWKADRPLELAAGKP